MLLAARMFHQSLAHFPSEIQSGKSGIFLFQFLNDAQALAVVLETSVAAHQSIQYTFAFMAERGMPKIMRQSNGFRQVFVQPQSARDVSRDTRNFDCVRQSGAQMIASAIQKNLGLIFQAAEGARVNDPV